MFESRATCFGSDADIGEDKRDPTWANRRPGRVPKGTPLMAIAAGLHPAAQMISTCKGAPYPDRNASFIPPDVEKDTDLFDTVVASLPVHELEIDSLDLTDHVAVRDKN